MGFSQDELKRPLIRTAADIRLASEVEAVLLAMFSDFDSIAVESEFGSGLSGSRVFRVRPLKGDQAHLPAVVKIAPAGLIRQEWDAYRARVENTLPGIARIESEPVWLPVEPDAGKPIVKRSVPSSPRRRLFGQDSSSKRGSGVWAAASPAELLLAG